MAVTKKDYTLSLTVSTDHVGYACLLPDNRILKFNDKLAFGVHEFPEAQTAEERRLLRSGKRIKARRKKRLQLLQEVFAPLLQEHPGFIQQNSTHRWQNDSNFHVSLSSLLNDLEINPTQYPTMYHLRHDLAVTTEKRDMRLIYIAIHNLVKKRGHFNLKGKWGENNQDQLLQYWSELLAAYEELVPIPISFDSSSYVELDDILRANLTNKEKGERCKEQFDKSLVPLINLLLDIQVPLNRLFPISNNYGHYKENKLKIQLSSEKIDEVLADLTEDERLLIELAQKIQQVYMLNTILGEYQTISEAKVHAYEVYSEHLKQLKEAFNAISPQVYRETFISSKAALKNYEKEPSEANFKKLCRLDRFLHTSKEHEGFYKYIQQILQNADEQTPHRAEILHALEQGSFLQRLKGRFNTVIPVQNNVYELQQILKNQQVHYPALTDELINQVVQIIEFKIPFYVGPLGNGYSPFSWVVRKSDETITPFNFKDVVDLEGSNEKWIQSLIGDCSFLKGEKVMPNHSLLYQEFKVLNELNVIQFRLPSETPSPEARIPQEAKHWLIENVFKKRKKVTHKAVTTALAKSPFDYLLYDEHSGEMKEIYGTSKPTEFSNALSSWHTFSKIFPELDRQDVTEMVENIIYWLSVYVEKEFVEKKIREHYPSITQEQLQAVLQLDLSGWGSVSRKFLTDLSIRSDRHQSVLDVMRTRCMNVSMVMKDAQHIIDAYNAKRMKHYTKFKYEQIDELAGSKAIKRGIWRALKIVEEITSILGKPSNIVLKVEKEEAKVKKRTKSRKEKWVEFGKAIPKKDSQLQAFHQQISAEPEDSFRNEKFWLYATQLGRCAFTNKPITLNNAILTTIYPRSAALDDSLDNKVLIHKDCSLVRKQGQMPLEMLMAHEAIHVKGYWEDLLKYKLISQRKYYRLLKDQFTEQDRINNMEQQLVERRQIVKHVEQLLRLRFPDVEVYTVRNALISAFRKHLELPRVKEINNKYIAMDTLLGGLLVSYSLRKYGKYLFKFDVQAKESYEQLKQNLSKFKDKFFLFKDFTSEGEFVHFKTGEPLDIKAWLHQVNETYEWQTTKMRTIEDNAFYDQTIYSPKITTAKYTSAKTAKGVHKSLKKCAVYAVEMTVKAKGKEKTAIKMIDMTNIEAEQWKGTPQDELAYLLAEKEANGEVIVHARILQRFEKGQKVLYLGKPFRIVASKELENAQPLLLPMAVINEHYELTHDKSWDNERAVTLFETMKNEMIAQLGHILTTSNIEAMESYAQKITDHASYMTGYNELMRASACSPARSMTLNFGGRFVKTYRYEDIQVVNESLTGLRYKRK